MNCRLTPSTSSGRFQASGASPSPLSVTGKANPRRNPDGSRIGIGVLRTHFSLTLLDLAEFAKLGSTNPTLREGVTPTVQNYPRPSQNATAFRGRRTRSAFWFHGGPFFCAIPIKQSLTRTRTIRISVIEPPSLVEFITRRNAPGPALLTQPFVI
jgi:hypothetical protein